MFLNALLQQAQDANFKVVTQAVTQVENCLAEMKVGNVLGIGLPAGVNAGPLVLALGKGAGGSAVEGKYAAWRGLDREASINYGSLLKQQSTWIPLFISAKRLSRR